MSALVWQGVRFIPNFGMPDARKPHRTWVAQHDWRDEVGALADDQGGEDADAVKAGAPAPEPELADLGMLALIPKVLDNDP